jgi:hypothetical protein
MIDRCKSRVGGGDVAKQTAKQGIGRVKERMNERRREEEKEEDQSQQQDPCPLRPQYPFATPLKPMTAILYPM